MFGNGKNLKKLRKGVVDTEKRKDFVIDDDAQFNVVEAFRKLKASLSVSIPKTGKGGVSIMVTSSYPEDGKTTVSVKDKDRTGVKFKRITMRVTGSTDTVDSINFFQSAFNISLLQK